MKVFLYFIGKPRDPHTNQIAAEFIQRASRFSPTQMMEIRPEKTDLWAKHPGAQKIFLDPAGKQLTSESFSAMFEKAGMLGRDLVFLIGGADGLPPQWRERADLLLSVSAMTLPHELARAIVAEQIYRAFAILHGHPYPR